MVAIEGAHDEPAELHPTASRTHGPERPAESPFAPRSAGLEHRQCAGHGLKARGLSTKLRHTAAKARRAVAE
jgi:hypothetical protein